MKWVISFVAALAACLMCLPADAGDYCRDVSRFRAGFSDGYDSLSFRSRAFAYDTDFDRELRREQFLRERERQRERERLRALAIAAERARYRDDFRFRSRSRHFRSSRGFVRDRPFIDSRLSLGFTIRR